MDAFMATISRGLVDHLSLAQCVGFADGSFHKVQHIWRDLQVQ